MYLLMFSPLTEEQLFDADSFAECPHIMSAKRLPLLLEPAVTSLVTKRTFTSLRDTIQLTKPLAPAMTREHTLWLRDTRIVTAPSDTAAPSFRSAPFHPYILLNGYLQTAMLGTDTGIDHGRLSRSNVPVPPGSGSGPARSSAPARKRPSPRGKPPRIRPRASISSRA